jgi:hypothetical protein
MRVHAMDAVILCQKERLDPCTGLNKPCMRVHAMDPVTRGRPGWFANDEDMTTNIFFFSRIHHQGGTWVKDHVRVSSTVGVEEESKQNSRGEEEPRGMECLMEKTEFILLHKYSIPPCSPGGSFIDQNTRTQPISSQSPFRPSDSHIRFLGTLLFVAPANACAESFMTAASGTVGATGALALTLPSPSDVA